MNTIAKIQKSQDLYQVILDNGIILNVSDLMVLDFDGAQNVAYRNEALGIAVENITVAASLEAETQAAVLEQLNASASGVLYLSADQAAALALPADSYSTIYVGDTADLDPLGGAFSGIAETTGATAAATKADNAFVLTNRIGSVEELAAVIAHEAGHLAGTLVHDNGNDGLTLDDFAEENDNRIVIDNWGTVSRANTAFNGMTHPNFGAAIYNMNGTLSTTNVNFSNNSAQNGGAVMIGSNALSADIRGGVFSANSAGSAGGAIATYASTYISGTLFQANFADVFGGGALRIGASATLSNVVFSANIADKNGGAIYNGGTVTISGGTFIGNTATESNGGAIFNSAGGNLNVFNGTIFESNFAKTYGGAILNSGILTVDNATFTRNSTNNTGGAIQNVHGCTATVMNALFTGNSAKNQGGAILAGGTTTITDNTFTGNIAKQGGAVTVKSDTGIGSFGNNTFSGNYASEHGGAIYNLNFVRINGGSFDKNSAGIGGGAILNAAGATASVFNATFINNSAASYGGAINNAGSAEIYGGTFTNNSATSGGAAILNAANASVYVSNATFEGNSVTSYGGAINNAGNASIFGGVFSSNIATSKGGAIYNIGSATISGATFTGNMASSGGVIFNAKSATISNAVFTGNTAASIGGAIFNAGGAGSNLEITGGTYTGNKTEKGGVLYNAGTATITGGTYTGNSASVIGGAIYNDGSATITGGTFTDNKANQAGAIFNRGSAVIMNAVFTGNTATAGGGAIYNNGTATITSGTFNGNSAETGGAIFNGGTVTLLGGNVFTSATDTIYNQGNSNTSTSEVTYAVLNFSGANTLGGNLTNDEYGTVIFDNAATTTLTSSAVLFNGNTATAQTLGGTLIVDHTATKGYESGDLADTILEGDWGVIGGTTTVDVVVAAGTTRTATLGRSFINANGAKLWFGSNNGKTGITDNTLVLNGDTVATDVDYATFKTLANLNETYYNFDGIINVTGGTYGSHLYGNKATLTFTDNGADMDSNYVIGGKKMETANDTDVVTSNEITIAANVTAKAVVGGNQFISTYSKNSEISCSISNSITIDSGTCNCTSFLAGGNFLNSTDTTNTIYTFTGSNELLVNDTSTTTAKIVVGGSIVGGKSTLTDNSDTTITLNSGTYTYVCGAGYIQNNDASSLTRTSGNVTVNINGGTYTNGIYGGAGASSAQYLVRAFIGGNISINVNCSANDIYVNSIYGGCSGKSGSFTAATTITFTGNGSKLHFASNNNIVGGGNGTKSAEKGTGAHTLAFYNFEGNFTAPNVEEFTKVTFDSTAAGKEVTFTKALNLASVSEWTFDANTSLDWQAGTNDFTGDTIRVNATATKTVIDGGAGICNGWDNNSTKVYLNGTLATWDDTDKNWYVGSTKLSCSNNDLIITLA